MKKFLIIALVFILMPVALLLFPAEENPAEEILMEMGFEYGSTEITEFQAYKEKVTEEYVLTIIPLMDMEVYLPKNFVDREHMHDIRRDNRVKENAFDKSYIEFFPEEESGSYDFASRRLNDGMLWLRSAPMTEETYEKYKTITLEELHPDMNKYEIAREYQLERYDYSHGEGYIMVTTNSSFVKRKGLEEGAFRVCVEIFTPEKYLQLTFYDVKGRSVSSYRGSGSRVDNFIHYAIQAKVID